MKPKVIENYTRVGIDAGHIVRRILSHLPESTLEGLNEVRLLDYNKIGFALYNASEGFIEIYVGELLKGFSPFFLRVFYPFSYTIIGMALCYELDHHVHRNDQKIYRETSAEVNIMKYMYPSLGIFKPIARFISFCHKAKRGTRMGEIKNG